MQDGNLGLKSLVKMTSTEMDGRLEALRALGKTATIQAAKLKERDHELISMEGRLRRTRRDVKGLKRENKKVCEERTYLRDRLEELNALRYRLEEDLKTLAMENGTISEKEEAVAALADREAEIDRLRGELEDTLEQVGRMTALLEGKDGELMELRHSVEEKDGEILELREELDRKGESRGRNIMSLCVCDYLFFVLPFLLTFLFITDCIFFHPFYGSLHLDTSIFWQSTILFEWKSNSRKLEMISSMPPMLQELPKRRVSKPSNANPRFMLNLKKR